MPVAEAEGDAVVDWVLVGVEVWASDAVKRIHGSHKENMCL